MKIQLLPSSFGIDAGAQQRQRLTTFLVDDVIAIDAGSLAFSCNDLQRESVRDILISHTHLDHIASLPIFIDDLFGTLSAPIRVHATREMIDALETNIFNWTIYPKFSELSNEYGSVLEYREFEFDNEFEILDHQITAVGVNHNAPSAAFVVSSCGRSICVTGDTAETDELWNYLATVEDLSAIFVECAFPDQFEDLADASKHLTPRVLAREVAKLRSSRQSVPRIIVSNIKAMYRDNVISEIAGLNIPEIEIIEVGKVYEF